MKMKDIAIFGAGGFGREVACMIQIINASKSEPEWNLIGFFDDTKKVGERISQYGNALGDIGALNSWKKPINIVIAIGEPQSVKYVKNRITNTNVSYPNIIHPDFIMADPETFKIGQGNIIQRDCSVSCDVTMGDFNVLNGDVGFGHDDQIGNFNTFMPGTKISGTVTMGDENFFGVGSIVLQALKIGSNVRLGAGSVMMTKPKDGNTYIGVPAKLFKY